MSRTDIDTYQQLAEQINQLIEEINGRFSRGGWQPIIYLPTDLPSVTLMALRRLANFCVVSSLHDGMNLWQKNMWPADLTKRAFSFSAHLLVLPTNSLRR
jgi:trehalose-6-phosphate synthase